jgi:hypothetical protein
MEGDPDRGCIVRRLWFIADRGLVRSSGPSRPRTSGSLDASVATLEDSDPRGLKRASVGIGTGALR